VIRVWNTAGKKPTNEPGFYSLQFSFEPVGGEERFKGANKIERMVKIFADCKVKEFEIVASDSPKGTDISDNQRAAFPGQLKKTITPENAKYIHAKIWIESSSAHFVPAQVFLQLTHVAKNNDAFFVAKLAPDQDSQIRKSFLVKLNLDSAEFMDSMYGSGEYSINIIVGDALLAQGITWSVGKASFTVGGSSAASSSSSSNESKDKDAYATQPDILHTFRGDDRRTSGAIAFVFSILVLVPLGWLVLRLLSSGLKYNFPGSYTDFLYTAVFQGSIGAILFVYILYWLSLNIFQALGLISVVAVVTVLSGNRALKALNHASSHQHTE